MAERLVIRRLPEQIILRSRNGNYVVDACCDLLSPVQQACLTEDLFAAEASCVSSPSLAVATFQRCTSITVVVSLGRDDVCRSVSLRCGWHDYTSGLHTNVNGSAITSVAVVVPTAFST